MPDLNQQIAEIDGVDVCGCGEQWHRGGDLCLSCDGLLHAPDYLAPENLHELVRVMENVFEAFDIGRGDKTYYVKGYIEKPSKIFKAKADSLSAALAEAIVEASK